MEKINLLDVINVYDNFDIDTTEKYIGKITNSVYKVSINDGVASELESLKSLLNIMELDYECLNDFYLSYEIPQISKEFDILKITDDLVINIELKTKSTKSKIKKQLKENYYYLKSLSKNEYKLYTYRSSENELFEYDYVNDSLIKLSNFDTLNDLLIKNIIGSNEQLSSLFDIKNYLVSPIEKDNEKFLNSNYFLTGNQGDIKREMMNKIDQSMGKFEELSLVGNAGTGKTLLIYDIAKTLMEKDLEVCLIHCGGLCQGHENLKYEGWEIFHPVDKGDILNKKYDVFIIDECHRVYIREFENLRAFCEKENKIIIYSYDRLQAMDNFEHLERNIKSLDKIKEENKYKLGKRIRTNPEIASFIINLFGLNIKREEKIYNIERNRYKNIIIKYVNDYSDLYKLLNYYSMDEEYQIIRYTPPVKRYHRGDFNKYDKVYFGITAHAAIGQEFNHVVTFLTETFAIEDNMLKSGQGSRSDYDYNRIFYNMITRTKEKLTIIVVGNKEVFRFCVDTLIDLQKSNE